MMKKVTKITSEDRKKEFEFYLRNQVKSAPRYIKDLEKGFAEAPILGYKTVYDITDPDLLENMDVTKELRASKVFTRPSKGGTAGLAGLNWYIRFLKDSRDSYYDFLNHFGIKSRDLFEWGMDAIIFPPMDKVQFEWENLKHRINNNEKVIIRGYGRDAKRTSLYIDFYKYVFKNDNIVKDSSNNRRPQANIKKMTGLARNKDIYNYQVSHIWGRTKNLFLFEAPWNICYTPKIIDPFTGHETKGDLPGDFQAHFLWYAQKKYKEFIDEYNSIIASYNIDSCLKGFCKINGINDERFVNDALVELSQIPIIQKPK